VITAEQGKDILLTTARLHGRVLSDTLAFHAAAIHLHQYPSDEDEFIRYVRHVVKQLPLRGTKPPTLWQRIKAALA
jgi:hypothetical protein